MDAFGNPVALKDAGVGKILGGEVKSKSHKINIPITERRTLNSLLQFYSQLTVKYAVSITSFLNFKSYTDRIILTR